MTVDHYGRTVGKIFLDNLNINKEMVKAGYAWVYVRYAKDKTLFALEKKTQKKISWDSGRYRVKNVSHPGSGASTKVIVNEGYSANQV